MNTKRWFLASVAVLVVVAALEFLIHGVLLSDCTGRALRYGVRKPRCRE